jgi:hypothetical protein
VGVGVEAACSSHICASWDAALVRTLWCAGLFCWCLCVTCSWYRYSMGMICWFRPL